MARVRWALPGELNRGTRARRGCSPIQRRARWANLLGGGEAADVTLNWRMAEVQRTDSSRSYELTARDAAGRDVDMELTLTNLAGANHAALGPSVILRDMTDRKRRMAEI